MRMLPVKQFIVGSYFFINFIFAGSLSIQQNPFQYSVEYTDTESHLQYLSARYYDAKTLRFIEQDSFDLLNRYAYADGNPIMNDDPSGHMSALVGTMLGITAPTAVGILLTTEFSTMNRFDAAALVLTAVSAGTGVASTADDDESLAIASIATMGLAAGVRLGYAAMKASGVAQDITSGMYLCAKATFAAPKCLV